MEVIKAIRNTKAERNVAPSKKVSISLFNTNVKEKNVTYIQKLAGVSDVNFIDSKDGVDKNVWKKLRMMRPLSTIIELPNNCEDWVYSEIYVRHSVKA